MERVKPIKLTDKKTGKTYVLEFNRASVKAAESAGFDLRNLGKAPMTELSNLFYYSFLMHHPGITADETDRLIDEGFGGISNVPDTIFARLGELYNAAFSTLADDEIEEIKKNPRIAVEL